MPKAAPLNGRLYGGISHEQRTAERYRTFIAAGIELFGTTGFRNATVRTVCRQAQLTDRYFYESFESMEDLLLHVYQQLLQNLDEQLLEATKQAPPEIEARVQASLIAYFSFMRDRRAARILFAEVLGVSRKLDQAYQQANARAALRFADSFNNLAPEFQAPAEDLHSLGTALTGAVVLTASAWVASRYREPIEQAVRNCQRVVMGTLRYQST